MTDNFIKLYWTLQYIDRICCYKLPNTPLSNKILASIANVQSEDDDAVDTYGSSIVTNDKTSLERSSGESSKIRSLLPISPKWDTDVVTTVQVLMFLPQHPKSAELSINPIS